MQKKKDDSKRRICYTIIRMLQSEKDYPFCHIKEDSI